MEMLKKISADEELREKYAAREKARLDAISSIKFAEMKGKAEGIEKGMEKGKAELLIRLLSKKIGVLPASLEEKIRNADLPVLDLLAESIFELNSIEEVVELMDKK